MPDVGTPQATWRDAPEVQEWMFVLLAHKMEGAMEVAVAAERRIQAATLRAKIEAMPLPFDDSSNHILTVYQRSVLAVLDAVLGGDS